MASEAILKNVSLGSSSEQNESGPEPDTRMQSEDDAIRMELFIRANPKISLGEIEGLTSQMLHHCACGSDEKKFQGKFAEV
jgi:hypothetical protein